MTDDTHNLHSADYFGEARDDWWNPDFVALMAQRWRLDAVRLALDVGAGVGHWGRVLAPHLPPEARMIGIDREAAWVRQAQARAAEAGFGARLSYRLGAAEAIPFHDETMDLVTCQTLLIHVADPHVAIAEMRRVLKPGGLLAVAEPNNLANTLVLGRTLFGADEERILDFVRLHLVGQRGKAKLGEGHNSIGDLLPGYFAEAGLEDVRVYLSDKAAMLVPPYAGREQQARRREILAFTARAHFVWDAADTRRYFLAGGGSAAEFERLWRVAGSAAHDIAGALELGTEHQAGGGVQYLVSGRKPR